MSLEDWRTWAAPFRCAAQALLCRERAWPYVLIFFGARSCLPPAFSVVLACARPALFTFAATLTALAEKAQPADTPNFFSCCVHAYSAAYAVWKGAWAWGPEDDSFIAACAAFAACEAVQCFVLCLVEGFMGQAPLWLAAAPAVLAAAHALLERRAGHCHQASAGGWGSWPTSPHASRVTLSEDGRPISGAQALGLLLAFPEARSLRARVRGCCPPLRPSLPEAAEVWWVLEPSLPARYWEEALRLGGAKVELPAHAGRASREQLARLADTRASHLRVDLKRAEGDAHVRALLGSKGLWTFVEARVERAEELATLLSAAEGWPLLTELRITCPEAITPPARWRVCLNGVRLLPSGLPRTQVPAHVPATDELSARRKAAQAAVTKERKKQIVTERLNEQARMQKARMRKNLQRQQLQN
jgi:hypothetical protein